MMIISLGLPGNEPAAVLALSSVVTLNPTTRHHTSCGPASANSDFTSTWPDHATPPPRQRQRGGETLPAHSKFSPELQPDHGRIRFSGGTVTKGRTTGPYGAPTYCYPAAPEVRSEVRTRIICAALPWRPEARCSPQYRSSTHRDATGQRVSAVRLQGIQRRDAFLRPGSAAGEAASPLRVRLRHRGSTGYNRVPGSLGAPQDVSSHPARPDDRS